MDQFKIKVDFSYLSKFKVIDKQNKEVGKIVDFALNNKYNATKFVLGGSFVEELRENLGLKPDNDPVVPVDVIEKISMKEKKAYLKVDKKDLKNKLQEGSLTKDDILFSSLSKCEVISKDGKKIGKIVDALFSPKEDIAFVLGDSKFVELLEKVGLLGDYDLLLPSKNVVSLNVPKEIKIDQTRDDLHVLLNNQKIGEKEILNSQTAPPAANLSVYSRRREII